MIDILSILTNRLETIESSIKYLADPYDDVIFEPLRQRGISETLGRIDELKKFANSLLDHEIAIDFWIKADHVEAKFRKLF